VHTEERDSFSRSESVIRNASFIYDNALAVLAFLSEGDTKGATLIADAICYAMGHDPEFDDDRLGNGYRVGDLPCHLDRC